MWDSVVRTESGSVIADGEVDSVSLPHADLMTGRRLAKEGLLVGSIFPFSHYNPCRPRPAVTCGGIPRSQQGSILYLGNVHKHACTPACWRSPDST